MLRFIFCLTYLYSFIIIILLLFLCFVRLLSITLEVAEKDYNPYSNIALSVEECHCPPNYIGLSCEECADGYYRLTTDPLGGICAQCQCNGHATTCDKVTGVCHVSTMYNNKYYLV